MPPRKYRNEPCEIDGQSSWSITLPMPPSVNAMFRNLSVDGRPGRVKTGAYRSWFVEASDALWTQGPMRHFAGEVALCMVFEYPRGPSDLDNRLKPVCDFLVKHQIIMDDNSKYVKLIQASWDAEVRGCRVTISGMK